MNNDNLSIADTLTAKTDQLNADDLMLGPLVVEVMSVRKLSNPKKGEQPLIIGIDGGRQPWKPCLSMRRVLAAMWGAENAREWVGRRLKLFRDASVTFGDQGQVGGIRIAAASHIKVPFEMPLTVTRGQKRTYRVEVLRVEPPKSSAPGLPDLRAWLNEANLSDDDLRDFMAAQSNRPVPPLDQWKAAWFADILKRLDGAWGQALPGWLAARNESNDGDGWGGDAA